jgi:hypothetical protein
MLMLFFCQTSTPLSECRVEYKMSLVYPEVSVGSLTGLGGTIRPSCLLASTDGITLPLNAGVNIDGTVVSNGQRVLLKDQSSPIENGIYVVGSGRATDYAADTAGGGVSIFVTTGTAHADTMWICTNDPGSDVIGTSSLDFMQIAGSGVNGDVYTTNAQTLTQKNMATGCTWGGNTVTVPFGGTGQTTFTLGNVLVGNGGSALTATLAAPTSAFVGITDTQTVSNKLLSACTLGSATQFARFTFVGGAQEVILSTAASGTITVTMPSATSTVATTSTTQNISNKALLPSCVVTDGVGTVAFTLNNGAASTTFIETVNSANVTVTLPSISTAIVGRSTTDTLTNKTATQATNDITARALSTASGASAVSVHVATAPIVGQVLTATSGAAATWQTPVVTGIYGANFAFVTVASFSTTATSVTLVTGSALTATLPAGTFCIEWSYRWQYSAVNSNFNGRFYIDGVEQTALNHIQEPQDLATTQRHCGHARTFAVLTAASHTADMRIFGGAAVNSSVYGLNVSWYRVA